MLWRGARRVRRSRQSMGSVYLFSLVIMHILTASVSLRRSFGRKRATSFGGRGATGRRGEGRAARTVGGNEVSICLSLFPFYHAHINSHRLLILLVWQEERDLLWREEGDAHRSRVLLFSDDCGRSVGHDAVEGISSVGVSLGTKIC